MKTTKKQLQATNSALLSALEWMLADSRVLLNLTAVQFENAKAAVAMAKGEPCAS